jgi:phosphoserine phosphatase
MKKKINVIDLDHTLLPYNSFTRFVLRFMVHWRCFLPILGFSILRIIGILRRGTYQKKILLLIRKTPSYQTIVQDFSLMLSRDINTTILRFIQGNTDEHTINVLCTASPEDYVQLFCSHLNGWECLCSTLDDCNDRFYHMYGAHKVTALLQHYPEDQYAYYTTISDSSTDRDLLALFDNAYLFKHNRMLRLNNRPPQKNNS